MSIQKIENTPFPMEFTGNETLIARVGADAKKIAIDALVGLDACGKTVITTDAYLFAANSDGTYKDTVKNVLLSLKAKEIIHTSYVRKDSQPIRDYVVHALSAQGCTFVQKISQVHDRYWLCLENKKAIVMNSISGLGKRTSTITELTAEEVEDLLEEFKAQGIIATT